MGFEFVTATKAGSMARIALMGISGAGKTYSALEIAKGLRFDGDVGLIDTDRRQALKYADLFSFKWVGMSDFDPDALTRATLDAARQNIGCLIIDTASSFWGGAGGMLDKVGGYASNFEGWRTMRPVERRMFDAVFGYPGHVIVTLRVKTEYVVERNDNGKMEPRRVGLKPEQRDGIEHEFDATFDLDAHGSVARVAKTRCPELAGRVFAHPGVDVGEIVQAWLERDAHGEPLNPHAIRDWALAEPRSFEELLARREALTRAGQIDAVVYDVHDQPATIGAVLTECVRPLAEARRVAEREQQRAAGAVANGAGR